MRVSSSAAIAALLLSAGCARKAEVASVPPPPVVPTVSQPRPVPPGQASATLVLPPQRSDGSFLTPNAGLSAEATLWHLRAALNVAALRCNDEAIVASYNSVMRSHSTSLATAHKAAMAQAGGEAAFDGQMTRLYNFFALPPVQTSFCQAAAAVVAEGARTPPSELATFAARSLPLLDAPFQSFFAAYAAYRADLARWQAGTTAPRVAYDPAVLDAEGRPGPADSRAIAAR